MLIGASVGYTANGPRPVIEEQRVSESRQAKVTTRTGDQGYTGLIGKERVPKWDPRPDTYGTVDEATSALGLARALARQPRVKDTILRLQRELYVLMAELATSPEEQGKHAHMVITAEHVAGLEALTEALKAEVAIGLSFIVPGETVAGAALDLARAIVRRAERLTAKLLHDGVVANPELLRYL
ncbi:MAG: ATP:cob(I)alamin adenosyltransferase, partial [Chloroflexota bacterium]